MAVVDTNRTPADVESTKKQATRNLEYVATKIQDRRDDLICRESRLRDKIVALERTIPALLAWNLWTSPRDEPPCRKVREMLRRLAPGPDATERLLECLRNALGDLDRETKELHDKIIAADVQLEEIGIELESVELDNKEMSDKIAALEEETENVETSSIHSIRTEDLDCLSKIRQLAKEEVALKNMIRELEGKEALFRKEMNRLLFSRECRNAINCNKRHARSRCELDFVGSERSKWKDGKKRQAEAVQVNDAVSPSETNLRNRTRKNEGKFTWISAWLGSQEKADVKERTATLQRARTIPPPLLKSEAKPCICPASKTHRVKSTPEKPVNAKPDSLKRHRPIAMETRPCNCKPRLRKSFVDPLKSARLCSKSPLCEPLPLRVARGRHCRSVMASTGGRCDCKERRARATSEDRCRCGFTSLGDDDNGYQLVTAGKSIDGSDSDEEFCECCSCDVTGDVQPSCICD